MVTNPSGALVEDTVLEVIQQGQLTQWREQLIFGKNIRRFDHFSLVPDKEYKILGLAPDEIKKLRATVLQIQRRILNTHIEPKMVYVANTNSAAATTPTSHSTIISKDQIKLMELLGEGTFAVVKRAIWCRNDGRKIDVAVKILRDMSPLVLEELKVEAGHLLKLKHPNLIQLYGVVQQPAMMVFELCEGGALLDRLRDDKKPILLLTAMLDYCLQIVKAMSYLEKEHCVHRDLATRNILLTSDEKTVKICDFGLMRNLKENEEMYIMGPQKRVPFSWCPPEALKHRKFSHASDVWAFGVTVWEIFSLGEDPWIGCRAIDVLKRLDAGERLEKPTYCSQQIYEIVALCWKVNPEHRPKFTQLKGLLQEAVFNIAEVRESQQETETLLGMTMGDQVIVVNNTGVTWYGQNMRTTKFGSFLRSSVFVRGTSNIKSVPVTTPPIPVAAIQPAKISPAIIVDSGNSKISRPIKGSFIHTGHGGSDGNSWGRPEAIDEIYMKNAILGVPLEPGIPLVGPSVTDPSAKAVTPTRAAPPPPKPFNNVPFQPKNNFDPIKTDWGDFEAAQNPNFSPSKIELPLFPSGALQRLGTTGTNLGGFGTTRDNNPAFAKNFVAESKPTVPSHHRSSQQPVQKQTNMSQNIIFPTPTAAGTLKITPTKPNPPLISSQTANKISTFNQPNVLGNGIKPPITTQAIPRPTTDRKDMPIIVPKEYRQPYHGDSRSPMGVPATPSIPSSSQSMQKTTSTIGKNQQVIKELNLKLQPTGGGPSFHPLHATPPNSITPLGVHLNTSASDPFVVSQDVKGIAEQKRYNEILEKVNVRPAQMFNPAPSQVRPHSTLTTNDIPCLTPMVISQPQKGQPPSTQAVPAVSRPSVPVTTQPPPPPSTTVSNKPLTVVIPEKKEERPYSSSLGSASQARVIPNTTPVVNKITTPVAAVTPAGTLPRGGLSEADRESRIIEEVASALPQPSALFFGKDNESSVPTRSSTSAPPRPHSVTGVPFPSVLPTTPSISTPTPVKPVDPLPISIHNVLQPIKLHSSQPVTPPQPASEPPKPERVIDVASIMNAYNTPMFTNPVNPSHPSYYPSQVPLFAIGGPAVRPQPFPITNIPYNGGAGPSTSYPPINLDDYLPNPSTIRTGGGESVGGDRLGQMEVLYKEASFVDPSRCDEMVKRCDGDIEAALKELKMDYLVDTNIAPDKGRAWSALECSKWDLNRAAEALLT